MQLRELGRSGLHTAPLAFGGNVFGWTADEAASFALLDFLARLLAGKPVSALAMFPQYRGVQEAAGAERIHPADLWSTDWRWREIASDTSVPPPGVRVVALPLKP